MNPISREKLNKLFAAALHAILIAAMFGIALWTIHELPAGGQVAMHWGPDGQPDAWVGEWAGLLIIPIVACVTWFLMSVAPQGFSSSRKSVPPAEVRRAVFSRLLFVQLAIQAVIAIHALGREVDTSNYIAVALGMLYIGIGALDKSRQAGRWIFVLSGLGMLVAAFGLERGDKVLGVFVLALGAPLVAVLHSYLRRRGRS
jgi:uncharacterized membrane protein